MTIKKMKSVEKSQVAVGEKTFIQVLLGPDETPNFAMRRFTIEPGGFMPYHTNTVEHEQLILRGEAEIVCNGELLRVRKNDITLIPASEPHSYRCIGDEPFEFLCLVPNLEDKIEMVGE